MLGMQGGFIVGVSWYKSRVWHQVSLLPEHRKKIIVKKHSGIVSIWDVDVNMVSKFKRSGVEMWAYLDDVIPDSF